MLLRFFNTTLLSCAKNQGISQGPQSISSKRVRLENLEQSLAMDTMDYNKVDMKSAIFCCKLL